MKAGKISARNPASTMTPPWIRKRSERLRMVSRTAARSTAEASLTVTAMRPTPCPASAAANGYSSRESPALSSRRLARLSPLSASVKIA